MKYKIARTTLLPLLTQALRTCGQKSRGETDPPLILALAAGRLCAVTIADTADQNIDIPLVSSSGEPEGGKPVVVSVSAAALANFARQVIGDEFVLAFDLTAMRLLVGSGRSRISLPLLRPTGLAQIDFHAEENAVLVEVKALTDALKSTEPFTATDPHLAPATGVRLTLSETGVIFAESTDNYRIARFYRLARGEEEPTAPRLTQIILPREVARLAADLAASAEGGIATFIVGKGQRTARLTWPGTVLTFTLESCAIKQFPQTQYADTGREAAQCVVSRPDLIRALKLCAVLDKNPVVYLGVSGGSDDNVPSTLSVSTRAENNAGEYQEALPVEQFKGAERGQATMLGRYLQKALDVCTSRTITLIFSHLPGAEEHPEDFENVGHSLTVIDGCYRHFLFPLIASDAPELDGEAGEPESGEGTPDEVESYGEDISDDGAYCSDEGVWGEDA